MEVWYGYLFKGLIVVGGGVLAQEVFKLKRFSFVYLSLIPLFSWYFGGVGALFLGVVIGLILSGAKEKEWWRVFLLLGVIGVVWKIEGLRIDQGFWAAAMGVINQQRGEHELGIVAKLLHNKSDLAYFWFKNVDGKLGMVAMFAKAKHYLLSEYYPLGLLLPFDLGVIGWGVIKEKVEINLVKIVGVGILVLMLGIVGGEMSRMIVVGVGYFLAVEICKIATKMKERWFYGWLGVGVLYMGVNYLIAFNNFIIGR